MKMRVAVGAMVLVVMAGCWCADRHSGLYEGESLGAYESDVTASERLMEEMRPPTDLYGYVPPQSNGVTVGDGITSNDGVSQGDGMGQVPFEILYEDVMSVMDVEEIGS